MTHLDERIYALLYLTADSTGFVRFTCDEIADRLGCHRNSAWKGTTRLAAAGRIEKYGRGGAGTEFKVVKR